MEICMNNISSLAGVSPSFNHTMFYRKFKTTVRYINNAFSNKKKNHQIQLCFLSDNYSSNQKSELTNENSTMSSITEVTNNNQGNNMIQYKI